MAVTFHLNFSGQQLIAAINSIAERPMVYHNLDNDTYILGQVGNIPTHHYQVLANGDREIRYFFSYSIFTVEPTFWGKPMIPVGTTKIADENDLRLFAHALRDMLMVLGATIEPKEFFFEFEGVTYRCAIDARNYPIINLPDGRVLEVTWSQIDPFQPTLLRVIGHVTGVIATRA